MGKLDRKWKKKIDAYFDGMSDEEFQGFLERTDFEFYNSIEIPVLSYLDAMDEAFKSTWVFTFGASPADANAFQWLSLKDLDVQIEYQGAYAVTLCTDISLFVDNEEIKYALAA